MATRILKLPEVIDRTALSRTAIYASMASGRFPSPVKLGARAVGWLSDEIEAWVAALPRARVTAGEIH